MVATRAGRLFRSYGWVAVATFSVSAWFGYREDPLGQLLLAVSLFATLMMGIELLARIRRERWSAAVMLLVVLGAVPLGGRLGYSVRLFDFEHRLRPEYELLIAKIERGEMEAEHVPISALGSLAYTVHARRDDMGILTVEFFWGRGFPLKHTAFIYRSNGAWAQDPRLDWRATRLADNWFRASD